MHTFDYHIEVWGIGFGEQEDGTVATVLQHVALKYDPDCANDHSEGDITENMMCAGVLEGGKGTGAGDSGGPLITKNMAVSYF